MKKIIACLLFLLFILVGCGNDDTIYEEKTIILHVKSDETPTFSANFGEGEYNEIEKIYTHKIDYIKDLYIYVSVSDLATETVYISTSEMNEDVIEKSITVNKELDAEIDITIDNVNSLEGLEITSPLDYSNFKIKAKNKFSLTVPSREKEYDIKFRLPNYKEFNIKVSSKELVSGILSINIPAITNEQIYIMFKGRSFEYKVYSITTNQEVSSGIFYQYENVSKYLILPSIDTYYVEIFQFYSNESELIKIPKNENYIFDFTENKESKGYLIPIFDKELNYNYMLYNKKANLITSNAEIFSDVDNYGIIIIINDKYFYLDDLMSMLDDEKSDSWNYYVNVDESKLKEVNLSLKTINTITKEEKTRILNGEAIYRDYGILSNDTFDITRNVVSEASIKFNLYDLNKEYLTTIEREINEVFNGKIIDGILNIDGKNIIYKFPLFESDLVYIDGKYEDIDVAIDANKTLVSIYLEDSKGSFNLNPVVEYNDAYLIDEDLNLIFPQNVDNISYFEVQKNTNYKLHMPDGIYDFTVKEEDINNGVVFIIEQEVEYINIKIPDGYNIYIDSYPDISFFPKRNGVISIPFARDYINGVIDNGFVSSSFSFNIDGREVYEILPFIATNFISLDLNYLGECYVNGEYYIYYSRYDDLPLHNINTIYRVNTYENGEYNFETYIVNFSDFVYSDELKAYYYDFYSPFEKIVSIDSSYYLEVRALNYVLISIYGDYHYCILGDSWLKVNDEIYDLKTYNSKYLIIRYYPYYEKIVIEEQEEKDIR